MPLTTETGVPAGARKVTQGNRALIMLIFGGVLVAGTGAYFRFVSPRPGTLNQAALGTRDYQTDGDTPGAFFCVRRCTPPSNRDTDIAVEQGDPRLLNVQQGGRDKVVEALMEPIKKT